MSKRNCRFNLCWHGSAYKVVDGENEVGFLIYFSGEWQARFVDNYFFTMPTLREIANKLDELNKKVQE